MATYKKENQKTQSEIQEEISYCTKLNSCFVFADWEGVLHYAKLLQERNTSPYTVHKSFVASINTNKLPAMYKKPNESFFDVWKKKDAQKYSNPHEDE